MIEATTTGTICGIFERRNGKVGLNVQPKERSEDLLTSTNDIKEVPDVLTVECDRAAFQSANVSYGTVVALRGRLVFYRVQGTSRTTGKPYDMEKTRFVATSIKAAA